MEYIFPLHWFQPIGADYPRWVGVYNGKALACVRASDDITYDETHRAEPHTRHSAYTLFSHLFHWKQTVLQHWDCYTCKSFLQYFTK